MHLLLVEDDDGHALLITQALKVACTGVSMVRVARGDDALGYLRRQPPFSEALWPQLVLLDLKLNGRSGLEVLSTLKQDPQLRLLPVVILSTSNAAKDRQRAYEAYANAYLVKPTDFDGFRDLAVSICTFWGRWNRSAT